MSEKEVLCASLDNTSISQGEENLGNSNPTYGVAKQFQEPYPVENADESCAQLQSNEQEGGASPEQDKNILTEAVSSDHEALKSNISSGSQESDVSHSSKDADKDTNGLTKEEKQRKSVSNHSGKTFCAVENGDTQRVVDKDLQDESEPDDCDEDVMTGSYGEISLDHELLNCDKNSDSLSSREDEQCFLDESKGDFGNNDGGVREKRPDSLILIQNTSSKTVSDLSSSNLEAMFVQQVHQSQQTSDGPTTSAEVSPSFSSEEFAIHSAGHRRAGSDTSGLSELQGTLTVDGDLVTFVAEDLQEKIKMSSPVSRWTDSPSFPGSRSSTPSLYRQALQPNLHIIDPHILTDLESHAKKVATNVDTMLENLSGTLQSISSLTVDCMETYESSVCKTCDSVDVNIKAVYQLMAKSEELNNSMAPLYKLSSDVKHIKKMLEQLEHIVEHKS